ncbi:hypothetical protein SS37_00005 [Enterobacter sichuanensis]|uniref:Uncharacterized protein n=1 Tax=Enterobacter sichuanensis TaxID=2071710 RepID=A0A0F1BF95_9ENTR|nr:hypothetical protein SS37_00005 [Enterobacter sichuanensis]
MASPTGNIIPAAMKYTIILRFTDPVVFYKRNILQSDIKQKSFHLRKIDTFIFMVMLPTY